MDSSLQPCPFPGSCSETGVHRHGTDQVYRASDDGSSGSLYRDVKGYCPMGCGETLVLSPAGNVLCASPGCPNTSSVSNLIDNDHIDSHIVDIKWSKHLGLYDFSAQHPLSERLNGELFDCKFSQMMDATPPHYGQLRHGNGRYIVTEKNGEFIWKIANDGR